MRSQNPFFKLLCLEIYQNCLKLLPKGSDPISYTGQGIETPWAKNIDLCLWDDQGFCIANGLIVNKKGLLIEAFSNTVIRARGILLPEAPNVFLTLQLRLTSCAEFSVPESPSLPQDYEGLVIPDGSPLRPAQREAVRKANAPISFIWGPPGTGKTYTIAKAVKAILGADCNNKVLVTATADKAVQALVDELLGLDLGIKLQQFKDEGNIPDVVHRTYDFHSHEASIAKTRESKAKHAALAKTAIRLARVLSTNTLSCCGKVLFNKFKGITHLIIDEASMVPMYMVRILSHLLSNRATETAGKPLKIVVVGDPNQLPSVVVSKEMQNDCMGKNIYHYFGLTDVTLSTPDNVVTFLDRTSRMPNKLTRTVSNTFYSGALKPLRDLGEFNGLFDVQGEQQVGYCNGYTSPWAQLIEFNPIAPRPPKYAKNTSMDEASEVTKLAWLCQQKQRKCLILTPYINQVYLINLWLKKNHVDWAQATTIHKAQGQEADIVIWSVVANIAKKGPSYFNRIDNPIAQPLANVALSRAKQQVFIIGADPNQLTVVGRFLANWEDAGSDLTFQPEVKA